LISSSTPTAPHTGQSLVYRPEYPIKVSALTEPGIADPRVLPPQDADISVLICSPAAARWSNQGPVGIYQNPILINDCKEKLMRAKTLNSLIAGAALWALSTVAMAQVPQYGTNINLDQARKALAAAAAEARKQNLPMAIAVVDNAGQLVAYERMDNTQTGSVLVSQDKAVSAAMFRRPTKAFQDVVAAGGAGLRILMLRGANAVEGGLPIYLDGKIIGGIGVSGGSSEQDGVIAKAGTDVFVAPK
jgi:uncharacterized protein GlcG (DUF336 family)